MANQFEVRFRVRVQRDDGVALGPGKVALLEAVARTGSISAAARAVGMSYRRAWVLIDETNRSLHAPAVSSSAAGTALTDVGRQFIECYRAIESAASAAAADDIDALVSLLAR